MRTKKPISVLIASLTVLTIIFWIGYEVYLILITQPTSIVDPKILEPITPSLDLEVLKDLSERSYFEEGDTTNAVFTQPDVSLTPSPIVTPTESPNESPTPTPTGN